MKKLFLLSVIIIISFSSPVLAQIDIDAPQQQQEGTVETQTVPQQRQRPISSMEAMEDPISHPVWQDAKSYQFPVIRDGASCTRIALLFEVPVFRDSNGDLQDPSINGGSFSAWVMGPTGVIEQVTIEIPLGGGVSSWESFLRNVKTYQEIDGRITYKYTKPFPIRVTKRLKPNWTDYRYFMN